MAQKHKSKYKAPKDLEKSQKIAARKDLKDYTFDDKDEKLNPKSTGEKQLNVLRKTDKEVVDNGSLNIKYDADDRLYKELEDGDYDPKTAAKRLKKRQDAEEKEIKDVIKDKIENLTREQKEQLVREYIRRKIQKVLLEQAAPEEETPAEPTDAVPAEETPAEETPAEPTDAAPTDVPTDVTSTPPPAPSAAPITPPAADMAPTSTETPESGEEDAEAKLEPDTKLALNTDRFVKTIKEMPGTVEKIKAIATVIKQSTDNLSNDDSKNFYQMLRTYAINKLERIGSDKKK